MNLATKQGFYSIASFLWSHHWVPDVPKSKTPNKKKTSMDALAGEIADKIIERDRMERLTSSYFGVKTTRLPPIDSSRRNSLTSNLSQC